MCLIEFAGKYFIFGIGLFTGSLDYEKRTILPVLCFYLCKTWKNKISFKRKYRLYTVHVKKNCLYKCVMYSEMGEHVLCNHQLRCSYILQCLETVHVNRGKPVCVHAREHHVHLNHQWERHRAVRGLTWPKLLNVRAAVWVAWKCYWTFANAQKPHPPPPHSALRTPALWVPSTPPSFISPHGSPLWTLGRGTKACNTWMQITAEPWHGPGSRLAEPSQCSSEVASLSL